MAARVYGAHAAWEKRMDRAALSSMQRLPGGPSSSFALLDSFLGRDEKIGFEDVLNRASAGRDAGTWEPGRHVGIRAAATRPGGLRRCQRCAAPPRRCGSPLLVPALSRPLAAAEPDNRPRLPKASVHELMQQRLGI